MSAYLGKLGSLERVACPSAEPRDITRESTARMLPSGATVVFEKPAVTRQWQVSGKLSPQEAATWEAYAYRVHSMPPFIWFSTAAAHHNILPPRDSLLAPGTTLGAGIYSTAAVALETGEQVRGSFTTTVDNAVFGVSLDPSGTGYRPIPVAPGVPVTGSGYVTSNGTARLQLHFLDAAGKFVGSSETTASPGMKEARRIARQGVLPPANAVSVQLRFVNCRSLTRPAITYTETVTPWAIGDGCYSAYVQAHQNSPLRVGQVGAAESSFSVIELDNR